MNTLAHFENEYMIRKTAVEINHFLSRNAISNNLLKYGAAMAFTIDKVLVIKDGNVSRHWKEYF